MTRKANQMRVLVCHNHYTNTSGEDLVITQDIQILRDRGITIFEYHRSNVETADYNLQQKIAFFPNAVYSSRTVKEVEALVKTEKPDVALIQNVFPLISPSVYHTLYRLNVPIVQLVYNYRLVCPNAILYTKGSICERCVKGNYFHAVINRCFKESFTLSALYAATLAVHRHGKDLAKCISAYVTPDMFLRDKLVQGGFPAERIFRILNPFDMREYVPSYDDHGYLVYFGRIVREKGIFTLLEAMRGLPNTRLAVIGGGEGEAKAREVVSRRGMHNIEFIGTKYGNDLISILQYASAVIVPSEWYDNSPLVIHQAFALGKPVIASDIDGIPEIVQDMTNGVLFEPGNVNHLREMIHRLECDQGLRRQLGLNARKKAEAEFTAERRFEALMKVISYAQINMVSHE